MNFADGQRRTCRLQIFADCKCLAGRRQISYRIHDKIKFCHREMSWRCAANSCAVCLCQMRAQHLRPAAVPPQCCRSGRYDYCAVSRSRPKVCGRNHVCAADRFAKLLRACRFSLQNKLQRIRKKTSPRPAVENLKKYKV